MLFNYLSMAEHTGGKRPTHVGQLESYLFDEQTGHFDDLQSRDVESGAHSADGERLDDWIVDPDPSLLHGGTRQGERPLIDWDV